MAILRTGFAALLLVCVANASQPLESARDQYKAHEDVPHPPQLLSEATDQIGDVHQIHNTNPFIKTEASKKSKTQPASTDIKIKLEEKPKKGKVGAQKSELSNEPRHRRHIEIFGINRHYYTAWPTTHIAAIVQVPPIQSYSVWQPPVYQISRPYFIPVWGVPGRIPMYFPPQPLFPNPGYPIHNPPPTQYLPPNNGYLPPDNRTEVPLSNGDNSTVVPTDDRFNNPVWDTIPPPERNTVPPPETTVRPTRRPRPQSSTTHPPLVRPESSGGSVVTTPAPPPAAQRPQGPPSGQRPQRPPSEIRPPLQETTPGRQPSRCVWAIISCCSGTSEDVSYSCFEQLGCTGAFWDTSPCQSDFARAAIANVMDYYSTNNS